MNNELMTADVIFYFQKLYAVKWLKYCRYGVNTIQSINQSKHYMRTTTQVVIKTIEKQNNRMINLTEVTNYL